MSEKLPDGWKKKQLSQLAKIASGGTPSRKVEEYWNGNIPWVTTGEFSSQTILGTQEKITELGLQNSSAKIFAKGTLLIAMYGQGKTRGMVARLGISAATNQACAAILFTEYYIEDFYFHCFTYQYDELRKMSNGGTQDNLSADLLKSFQLLVPPLPEQQKIARIISTWNAAIDCTQKLLENSRQQKKALMQQLLTGKKRLPGFAQKWAWNHMGDIAKPCGERNSIGENLPVLACSKYTGFVDSLSYFKKQVFSEDTSTYKVIRRGEFGYPANHIEEGAIGYQNLYDAALVSPIYVVFKVKANVNGDFLYRLLKTDAYRQIFSAATSASVDRRGSLRWPGFAKIKMYLPSVEEQTAIAEVLSAADAVISQYEAKLANLQAQKKALMQQLLTGKRRVKVDNTADTSAAPAS
ncbi:restriction endonuclease subunit S [Desulfovibrio sp. OttesenSCG-928-A18]|nr:restriction endonuclease subunit S [Desulfovibrio sp. OttesenSCG-928-A18]